VIFLLTNFTGHPVITLKLGFTEAAARRSGLVDQKFYGAPSSDTKKQVPACITLWGPLFEEGKICQIASVIEQEAGVSTVHPSLEV
jgi:Asp-tRNA(Asn)/Glu-tRNA(Gln) amidotransferase A subunit family amidase